MNRFAYSASLALTLTGIITAAVFLFPTVARPQSSEWLVFDTDNSELPDNYIRSLAIDVQDNLWIGTGYGGLAKFDGENWLVYDIGSYDVRALAIDTQGKIWTVVSHHMFSFPCGRLAKFDRASLTLYDTGNSGLRDNDFQVLAIDAQGNKWLGTYKSGLAKFDGANWTVYDTDNSELPDNYVKALVIDTEENKWIGTSGGLAVYREGGVILTGVEVEERSSAEMPSAFSLSQNYPNPFNPSTEICFSVPAPSHVKIAIYNVLGQLVRELTDRTYAPGVYRVQWNGTDSANTPVSSGVYLYRMTTNAGAITKRMLLLR
ncbi:MAG: T9SS type A sorting domain-containing protein [Candidatus Latescibacteria bacterium]|nr:T9SS type A sorting domain-containing protein [Candidatus Latescibacterota bacterium]